MQSKLRNDLLLEFSKNITKFKVHTSSIWGEIEWGCPWETSLGGHRVLYSSMFFLNTCTAHVDTFSFGNCFSMTIQRNFDFNEFVFSIRGFGNPWPTRLAIYNDQNQSDRRERCEIVTIWVFYEGWKNRQTHIVLILTVTVFVNIFNFLNCHLIIN